MLGNNEEPKLQYHKTTAAQRLICKNSVKTKRENCMSLW